MQKKDKRILLLEEIKTLHEEQQKKQVVLDLEKENSFSKFCTDLHKLYEEETEEIYAAHIRPFCEQYPFLKEPSSLVVINKYRSETYHSLFLKHIWSSSNYFSAEALKDFLIITLGKEEEWFLFLQQRTFEGKAEVLTNRLQKGNDRKRIDLLFVDVKNEWYVTIENKIDSEVHYSGERSQLDYYYKHCEKEYKEYKRLYILLSHNHKNRKHKPENWIYADYYNVFKSLLKYHSEDSLVRDYLKTLFKLLFPNEMMLNYKGNSLYRGKQFYDNIISNIK